MLFLINFLNLVLLLFTVGSVYLFIPVWGTILFLIFIEGI